MNKETEARIRAAGAVQAVIASGRFNPEEWRAASLFAVSMTSYVTGKILKKDGIKPPSTPTSLKESQ